MQKALGLSLAAIAVVTVQLSARRAPKDAQSAPLVLTGAISLENVHGRIDHFGFDPKNRLFVSALGNNSATIRRRSSISAPNGWFTPSPECPRLKASCIRLRQTSSSLRVPKASSTFTTEPHSTIRPPIHD